MSQYSKLDSWRGKFPHTANMKPIITPHPDSTTGYRCPDAPPTRCRGHRSIARPSTARPRTGLSTIGVENQEIICVISESRGISPTVGLAFVNLDTGEAVISQISDNQTYVRTIHKLAVFSPSTILIVSTAGSPKSKLFTIIEDSLEDIGANLMMLDRRHWDEDAELALSKTFRFRSLRIKYETSEGSMTIDLSTIRSLELVQNLRDAKSKDCLFGLLNETLTPMGARLLRNNIMQPSTNADLLMLRYNALEELNTNEEMYFAVRQSLKTFLDVDRTLARLILVPVRPSLKGTEQAMNNVIMLKTFVNNIKPVVEALRGARSSILQDIRAICASETTATLIELIDGVLNTDTTFARKPLDLRNQRTYAVRSGVNGLLDVARQMYKEAMEDAFQHITTLNETYDVALQIKYDNRRQFYLRISAAEFNTDLQDILINVVRKKEMIECSTLDLVKLNQRITHAHDEVLCLSDASAQNLITNTLEHLSVIFRICDALAMLDMLASFATTVTTQDYIRPQIDETLAIKAGRHPICEKVRNIKFIPNDIYATQQTRFQIITGCNMSGKSTYIRSVALITVMAQIGCFVPAQFAVMPIRKQLFARISMDDCIEANLSTFASEMREAAFILRNIDRDSLAIVDELCRGTSTRDGLAIAIAIAEALIESRALVWFATHFVDLSRILSERSGVISMHLQTDMSGERRMEMLYHLTEGVVQDKHYGLKLACLLPFPPDVLEYAERVSHALALSSEERRSKSLGIINARRRKLILNLREHLVHARNGAMNTDSLRKWLNDLQTEFVVRMTALDDEASSFKLSEERNDHIQASVTSTIDQESEDVVMASTPIIG